VEVGLGGLWSITATLCKAAPTLTRLLREYLLDDELPHGAVVELRVFPLALRPH
jgi:hypothetical protein